MQEESITEIEKNSNNIVTEVKSMIQNIKDINKLSHSMSIVSLFMISYEGEKQFIQKYEYYLYLFNTLLSFFKVEVLNSYNNDLFNAFIELLYETLGHKIIIKKIKICYQELNLDFFRVLFTRTHTDMLLYSSPEEPKNFFDLIEKEFYIYMNNLYGMIFRRSLSKEENKMIHMDYMFKNKYSIYSLDYIFFEELYDFMIDEHYQVQIINNDNIIHNVDDNNDFFEEEDIYS
jgi:hypothetical protein